MNDQNQAATENRGSRSAHLFIYLNRWRNLLRKRWWVLPVTITLALGIQSYLIWGKPPGFTSLGRMIINVKLMMPTASGAQYAEDLSNFLGTQVALMKSDTVCNRAFARVKGLASGHPAEMLPLKISVSPKTSIFNLEATGAEPEYTRAYLQACMDEYGNLKKEMRAQTSDTTLAGIMDQLTKLEEQSKAAQKELLSFQSSNSVVLLQEQGGSASSYLASVNRTLATLKSEYRLLSMLSLDQNLELRRQKEPGLTTADAKGMEAASENLFGAGSDYLKIKQEIQLRKVELQQLSEFLRPKHPEMVYLSESVGRSEKLLEIFKQQSQEQLETRRNSLELQIQNVELESKEWEAKSLDISRNMAEYQKLKDNVEWVQNLYRRLLDTMQTVGVGKQLDPESVVILERASVATPTRGDVPLSLTLAAFVGLALGFGLLMLLDRFDDRLTSFSELQELFDEPVLGQVPLQNAVNGDSALQLVQADDDRHGFAEAYRNLRSSLLYMGTANKRTKVILFTSAVPGDGKSTTVANLAITMANDGSRVLLVDADMRKGVQHKLFEVASDLGLHEVLTEQTDLAKAVVPTSVPNLSLLPRGGTSRNPGKLFLSQKMERLIGDCARQYDYVVFDCAPVMAADDATALAPRVEGVIFVIRANGTPARVAHAALELLYQRNVDVLGLVLNAVNVRGSEYYLYKYKDYYSSHAGK